MQIPSKNEGIYKKFLWNYIYVFFELLDKHNKIWKKVSNDIKNVVEKKMSKFMTDDIEISSHYYHKEDSDEEN